MTYNISKYKQTDISVLKVLRSLVPLRKMNFADAKELAELQAIQLRSLLDAGHPIFPVEHIINLPRIDVAYEFNLPYSGSAHWNGDTWMIVLNGDECTSRQRFSLLHEFKHILDHSTRKYLYTGEADTPPHKQAEELADYFAGCVLVPSAALRKLYRNGTQSIVELANHFKVSPRAIRCRLRQTGLLEQEYVWQRCSSYVRRNTEYTRRIDVNAGVLV